MTLEMMYVYFDKAGDIKCIAPESSDELVSEFRFAMFPINDVEMFLTGKKNSFDYFVETIKRVVDVSYRITRKPVLELNQTRLVENYLVEIMPLPRSKDATILIENSLQEREITISLNPGVRSLLIDGTDAEQDVLRKLVNTQLSSLFFTRKHDPYFLITTISFSPKLLFSKSFIKIQYEDDLSSASLFTKRLLDGYSYSVK